MLHCLVWCRLLWFKVHHRFRWLKHHQPMTDQYSIRPCPAESMHARKPCIEQKRQGRQARCTHQQWLKPLVPATGGWTISPKSRPLIRPLQAHIADVGEVVRDALEQCSLWSAGYNGVGWLWSTPEIMNEESSICYHPAARVSHAVRCVIGLQSHGR